MSLAIASGQHTIKNAVDLENTGLQVQWQDCTDALTMMVVLQLTLMRAHVQSNNKAWDIQGSMTAL